MATIREPQKRTSKAKKEKIIQAGLKVFTEKGFYKTSTAEIAKVAGVSTGIIYNYFLDKKDILLSTLRYYFDKVTKPIKELICELTTTTELNKNFYANYILTNINVHKEYFLVHNQFYGISYLEKEVHQLFLEKEKEMLNYIYNKFCQLGLNGKNLYSKIIIANYLIENYTHNVIENNIKIHENILQLEIIKILENLFEK